MILAKEVMPGEQGISQGTPDIHVAAGSQHRVVGKPAPMQWPTRQDYLQRSCASCSLGAGLDPNATAQGVQSVPECACILGVKSR